MTMIAELIHKFFNGDCSAEERIVILNYFKAHPEELDNYFSESEWAGFKDEQELDDRISKRMRHQIQQSVGRKKTVKINSYMVAAASLLLFIAAGVIFFKSDRTTVRTDFRETTMRVISKSNDTDSIMIIQLPDYSRVQLMQGSTISYDMSYGINKRDLKLVGEAIFKVAKDKAKPFTVYSNEISTTALGTEFRVSAFTGSKVVRVHLYEGKVVIHPVAKLKENYYLLPGDRLVYNRETAIANLIQKKSYTAKTNGNPAAEGSSPGNWYMFNNQDLALVFEQIESIYNVKINYSDQEISNIKFIGKIQKSDSISTVLKDIAQINNLKIVRNGDTYSIRRKK